MEILDAQTLALELMVEHGLIDKGWHFEFDDAVRRFGCTHYNRKAISLSRKLLAINDASRVAGVYTARIGLCTYPERVTTL